MTEQDPNPHQPPPPAADDPIAALTRERDEARDSLAAFRASFATAMARHRDTLRAANPTIPADLITGDTPEELAASVERGKTIRDQVLAASAAATASNGHAPHVPAGGSPAIPNTTTMTPREKILSGLQQQQRS